MSSIKTTKVTYKDGHSEELTVTMFEQIMATRYLKNNHLGTVQDEPVTFMAYQVYAKLRSAGQLNEPFEQWLRSVVQIEDIKPGVDTETIEAPNGTVIAEATDAPDFLTGGTPEA
ncbi:hypothetical protein [Bifidobacterium vansinderenii]|uniref:Uncharacterized protein n=1 Tax=Bifidobacterium vansinderenii TaxID=1984871 RepID=A0A229VZQ8_9BIFI|nr:hypothetical protein [Bifidobacterium vansinderenii]OXN01119.1 hypothetical protein Tam10B_0698 [Bifidobacterium vansinderenii]